MTKFLQKSFSVSSPGTQQYRDNWDAIFDKKEPDANLEEGLPVVDAAADAVVALGGFRIEGDKVFDPFGQHIANASDEQMAGAIADMFNWLLAGIGKSDIRTHVEEFHRKYELPIEETPRVPDVATIKLRIKLIVEEMIELLAAIQPFPEGVTAKDATASFCERLDSVDIDPTGVDLVEVADALGDLDYVVEGMRLSFGINGKPIADEIQRSNMSKLGEDGRPVKNEYGKVVKGPNFKEPDIRSQLVAQGWEGEDVA